MIIGVGTDLIEIERVQKACVKEGFLRRCFTEKEQAIIAKRSKSAAGNFAVKEGVYSDSSTRRFCETEIGVSAMTK